MYRCGLGLLSPLLLWEPLPCLETGCAKGWGGMRLVVVCERGWGRSTSRRVGGGGCVDLCLPSLVPGDQNFARGSPLFAEFAIFAGPVAVLRAPTISSLWPPLCLEACVWGVRPSGPLQPNFCQGFPLGFQNPNFFLARCWSVWAPSHFPAPPPVLLSVCGGVRPLKSCRPKIFQGFPPWGQNFGVFA